MIRPLGALALALALGRVALAGRMPAACRLHADCTERPCGDGSYPMRSPDGTGQTCIPEGQPVPSEWEANPPGQTPTVAGENR